MSLYFVTSLVKERQLQLKEITEVALGIIAYQKSLPNGGDIDAALRNIHFGSAGYFYIYDTKGVNIFHAVKPALQGKNLIDLKDSKGNKLIVGLLDAAQHGDGIYSFYYQKPNSPVQLEKLGYAAMVPDSNWMLGTGAYIEDIEEIVLQYATVAKKDLREKIVFTLFASVGINYRYGLSLYLLQQKQW